MEEEEESIKCVCVVFHCGPVHFNMHTPVFRLASLENNKNEMIFFLQFLKTHLVGPHPTNGVLLCGLY